jgi:pyruvate carboxylase
VSSDSRSSSTDGGDTRGLKGLLGESSTDVPDGVVISSARGGVAPRIIQENSPHLPFDRFPTKDDELLIINRGHCGQMAVRAAHELGIKTVALVEKGDIVPLGVDRVIVVDRAAMPLYLDVDRMVDIAKREGIRWTWPGWGFISENDAAYTKFRENGVFVVGAEPSVIKKMGDKTLAREIAASVGAPVIPGSHAFKNLDEAIAWAEGIGYPVMLKAVSGGGGKGMRPTFSREELIENFEACSAEALASFGDGSLFAEKLITGKVRHIEVQVFGDMYGDIRDFSTRDCSAQRRNQKVVEEAPADPKYDYLAQIAVKIAQAAGYSNAGTVEFIIDERGNPWFMEMNTRLQVEHTITEEIHPGLNLIASQLRVAMGEPLHVIFRGISVQPVGHAVEVRLTTESLNPAMGTLMPTSVQFGGAPVFPFGNGIRVEAVPDVSGVSPQYDSNFGALIAHAPTREVAIARMHRALEEGYFAGSDSVNTSMLRYVLRHPDFVGSKHYIKWLEGEMKTVACQKAVLDPANNPGQQTELLMKYVAEISVNGTELPTGGKKVSRDLPAAIPPVVSQLPPGDQVLFGLVWERAGGGVRGAEAVVKEWKRLALSEGSQFLLGTTRYRDWAQTAMAGLERPHEERMSAPYMGRLPFAWHELGGGAKTHCCILRSMGDPMELSRELTSQMPGSIPSMLVRDVSWTAYGDKPLHPTAIEECARMYVQEGGIKKVRIFQGMNDKARLKEAIAATAKQPAILDVCMAFHAQYSPEEVAEFFSEMYDFCRSLGVENRVIFTIKDAQGLMGMEDIRKLRHVPSMLDVLTGSPQIIGVHTHDQRRTSAAMYAQSAEYGFRHGDVASEKMALSNTQPGVESVVQLLAGTPYDTRFPLEALDALAAHELSLMRTYAPVMPQNEVTASQSKRTGLPPGMINNVRIQYQSAGGDPQKFSRFLDTYALVLNDISCTTGVTPYSKIAGDTAIWVVLSDVRGDVRDLDSLVHYLCANAAQAPNSFKLLMRGGMGEAQFGFHPEVRRAFLDLPDHMAPPMERPSDSPEAYRARMAERHAALEAKYSRSLPAYFATLEELFGGDVSKMLDHQAKWGTLTGSLPMHVALRGLNPGEVLELKDAKGLPLKVEMVSVGDVDPKGFRTVVMKRNGRLVEFRVADKASATGSVAKSVVRREGEGVVAAQMRGKFYFGPGAQYKDLPKAGDRVKKGDVVAYQEAMKMFSAIVATKDGVFTPLEANNADVEPGQALFEIK